MVLTIAMRNNARKGMWEGASTVDGVLDRATSSVSASNIWEELIEEFLGDDFLDEHEHVTITIAFSGAKIT